MRQNQNAKRSRGRGRRSGNSGQNSFNRNTTFESNGPEGRLRGNAQQLFEKYTSLANDAQSSGERVLFEANSQFADHYYRIQQSILANAEQRRQNDERSSPSHQGKKSNGRAEGDAKADQGAEEVAGDNKPAKEGIAEKQQEDANSSDANSADGNSSDADSSDANSSDDSAAVA